MKQLEKIFRGNISDLTEHVKQLIKPKEKLKGSKWAEAYRIVSPEVSARPGKWSNLIAPFGVEIMDCCTDNIHEEVTVMGSAQVLKTEIILNTIGYYIHYEPSSIMVLQPTLDMARAFSNEKLYHMLKDSPELAKLVKVKKTRDKENSTLHKTYPGGAIDIVGGNSPNSLAMRSKRVCITDDEDRVPESAGEEGDPVELAEKRTTSFPNRKKIRFSTPTTKGKSRVEFHYNKSDMRKYHVPCPYCNTYQVLEWERLVWEKEEIKDELFKTTKIHHPETVRYACINGCEIEEMHKAWMIANGIWIAEKPEVKKHVGFWIWEAYSPFKTWEEIVGDFLRVKDDDIKLKTFINTSRAEVVAEDVFVELNEDGLEARNENYLTKENPRIPNEILFITVSVDTQPDRLEAQIMGFGMEKETWVLFYEKVFGNPDNQEVWIRIDEIRHMEFTRADGIRLQPKITFIDSGGHNTQSVYDYTRARRNENVFAIKGRGGSGYPAIINRSKVGRRGKRTELINLGVDTLKQIIYSRLKNTKSGSNYFHTTSAICDSEYFKGLTSERKREKITFRGKTFIWEKKSRGVRNEPLDLTVYGIAAFEFASPNLKNYKKIYEEKAKEMKNKKVEEKTGVGENKKRKTVVRKHKTIRRTW